MKAVLLLKVACRNDMVAKKLASVLAADNRGLPAEQRMSMTVRRGSVVFRIESGRLGSGLSTVSSILRDVTLFQEIWLAVSEYGRP